MDVSMHGSARLRIVFCGTPDFAVPSLRALLTGPDEVAGVVCQPDRPAGRHQRLQMPPVKVLAQEHGVPVTQPMKLRGEEFLSTLRAWGPDLVVVAAYGRILPKAVLDLPPRGCINVHASLLPKYRGAAPIQWAILRGESATGVTIMFMNERMDEGEILLQCETPIGLTETCGVLQDRLARLGADALVRALVELAAGRLRGTPQDHAAATLAPMIQKADGRIDWATGAEDLARIVRAFNPWPSAFTWLAGTLVKVHGARALSEEQHAEPGTVVGIRPEIKVATGRGILVLEELQIEGRKRLPAAEFARGGVLSVGVQLGAHRAAE